VPTTTTEIVEPTTTTETVEPTTTTETVVQTTTDEAPSPTPDDNVECDACKWKSDLRLRGFNRSASVELIERIKINIARGFCRFLRTQSQDTAECTCTRFEFMGGRRRERMLNTNEEWMVEIEVTSESAEAKTRSMIDASNSSMREQLGDEIHEELSNDPVTAVAISTQEAFTVTSNAASSTSVDDSDDDDEGFLSGVMLYAAAGGAAAVLLAVVSMSYCYCKNYKKNRASQVILTDSMGQSTMITTENELMTPVGHDDLGGLGDDIFIAERRKSDADVFKL